jgi:hypothetical protein
VVLVFIGVLLVAQLWDNAIGHANRVLDPLVASLSRLIPSPG